MIKVCLLQRESNVARGVSSLSVQARIGDALDYLCQSGKIQYIVASELEKNIYDILDWCNTLYLCKHMTLQALKIVEYAKNNKKNIIYDIDDWIFNFPEYSGFNNVDNQTFLLEILSHVKCITVSNKYLYDKVSGTFPNSIIVPNGIWVEKYNAESNFIESNNCDDFKIVFANADFLKINKAKFDFINAVQYFFFRNKKASMVFYGDLFPEIFSMPFINYVNRVGYGEFMKSIVNGRYMFSITPLGGREDPQSIEFNQCKNPFKYLNYGVAKIPGIYSRSSIYSEIIEDGENGILTDNSYESWLDKLELVSNDKNVRNRIVRNAYQDIKENHNIKICAAKILELL
jgi:processive 1,2-diacylglycerol beta-glucosyltransferase